LREYSITILEKEKTMTSKNTYRVGTDGTANYATLAEVPSTVLVQGNNTLLLYPGTYTAPTNAVYNDLAIIGVGDREEIVINGGMTIANTSTGTITFENVTFAGADASATGGAACVTKLGAASAPLHFKRVTFSNAEHAVSHNGERAFATTNPQVILDYCDASGVDQAIVANANVSVNWSALNTSANAYFQPGTGGGAAALTVTVRASTSGGSNAGVSTETVLALIS
jgi:hypothetical protein